LVAVEEEEVAVGELQAEEENHHDKAGDIRGQASQEPMLALELAVYTHLYIHIYTYIHIYLWTGDVYIPFHLLCFKSHLFFWQSTKAGYG
jgi:hypothetical protein